MTSQPPASPEPSPNQVLFERLNAARIEQESAEVGDGAPRRSRARRSVTAVIITVVIVGVLFGGLLLANSLARSTVQDSIRSAAAAMGSSRFQGTLDVAVGGDWPLFQVIGGTLEEVRVTSDNAVLRGIPMRLDIRATDVPTSAAGKAGLVEMTTVLDQAALNSFIQTPGKGTLTLGDGTLGYSDAVAGPFGLSLGVTVTAAPSVEGTTLSLAPVGAEVTTPVGNLNVAPLVQAILGSEPMPICLADRLPEGAELTGITASPAELSLSLRASDIALSTELMQSRGECPPAP